MGDPLFSLATLKKHPAVSINVFFAFDFDSEKKRPKEKMIFSQFGVCDRSEEEKENV